MQEFEYRILRTVGRAIPLVAVLFLAGFAWSAWNLVATADFAIPGTYQSQGSWGRADLRVQRDGTFAMTVDRPDRTTDRVHGTWLVTDRDYFWRDVRLQPFVGLSEDERRNSYEDRVVRYGSRWLHAPGFYVDPRADIFLKRVWW